MTIVVHLMPFVSDENPEENNASFPLVSDETPEENHTSFPLHWLIVIVISASLLILVAVAVIYHSYKNHNNGMSVFQISNVFSNVFSN